MSEEERTVTIKLYPADSVGMTITYKDKQELFRKFKKSLLKLNFPTNEIYWRDWENFHTRIRTADDLAIAVRGGYAWMFARNPRDRETFPSFSSDDEEERKDEGKLGKVKKSGRRSSSPSPDRVRGRSRSEPRRGLCPCSGLYPYYPTAWNYDQWMDPRYASYLCYCHHPHISGEKSRHQEKKQ